MSVVVAHRGALALLGAALLGACTSDDVATEAGEAGEADSTETGAPSFEPPDPACGNGYLEDGEQCDDANLVDGDGCDSLCRIPCGMVWEATVPSPALDVLPVVVDVAVGPSGEVVVAGFTDAQSAEVDDDVWLGAWSSTGEPLWSGSYELAPELDDAAVALAIGSSGEIYLAATVEAVGGEATAGTNVWVGRYDATGTEVWSAVWDSPIVGSKDVASGIAITPAGDPVVAGHMRVGDGDTDLWIAELSPADGAEQWSTTWSGPVADNGYSLDRGGPLAIGPDGTIWATAIEYVTFETFDVHVLSFDPNGVALGDWVPQAVPGIAHEHTVNAITVLPDGSVEFLISRLGPGATFWLHRLDPTDAGATGELVWVREMPSFVDAGEDWLARGVAAAPDGNLFVGGYLHRDETDDDWYEGWMHRLDPSGEPICTTRYTGLGSTILAPNLLVTAIAAAPPGVMVPAGEPDLLIAAGRRSDVEDATAFWVGAFRGP